jgi:hypothetical protein
MAGLAIALLPKQPHAGGDIGGIRRLRPSDRDELQHGDDHSDRRQAKHQPLLACTHGGLTHLPIWSVVILGRNRAALNRDFAMEDWHPSR